ncbi:hypothetical protein D4764_22G0005980 [Takifugu flavidus]|uniref:Uncharacterized protein n=1 Tax=Takifugu flavidus TaxID=433684 RepID=A0A5C6NEI2_9TELE|nr:hypothetical protein D4764_22G0005980 [Takifugu flavidus]
MSLQGKPLHPRRRTDLILRKFLCILGVISITAALPIVSPMPHEKPDLTTHPTAEWPLRERRQAPTTSPSSRCASGTAHLFIPQVCLLPNTWATVIVPLSSISNLENTAAGYAGNQWYMTNDQLDTGWHTLVADPPGQDWSSYTTTNSARRQRPLLTLTSTSNKLTLTVNLTKGSLLDDPDGSGCWLFLMWAWKDGTDPSFLLQLCVDRPNGTPIDPMPAVLSPKATSSGIKLVLEPTVDDYFEIMTGSVSHTLFPQTSTRIRRFADGTGQDSTYIDAIGIPRGVPDEYKVVNQIAAGFESTICWWCTINKNVDRINYIHYNVQRLANYTRDGLQAVHEQLRATSMMAFQNRALLVKLINRMMGERVMHLTYEVLRTNEEEAVSPETPVVTTNSWLNIDSSEDSSECELEEDYKDELSY